MKKQKFDRKDARLLLRLLRENNFPRIWIPDAENRDLRQLLWHRHRLVQMRTRIMNQLHALAMNEGYCWKEKLFSEKGRGTARNRKWREVKRRPLESAQKEFDRADIVTMILRHIPMMKVLAVLGSSCKG